MAEAKPTLYILMRTDMASMNAGKAMAQASHASNAFVKHAQKMNGPNQASEIGFLYEQWESETEQGFGTVIVLAVNEEEMRETVDIAKKTGLIADVIHDPTYPLVDGRTVHLIPVDTCAYVFGDRNNDTLRSILADFKLHK